MARNRTNHSVEFKDSACELVMKQAYKPSRAAKELGIPEMTLRSWLKARGWRGPIQAASPDQSDDPQVLKRTSAI
jgi:transposase-like protein